MTRSCGSRILPSLLRPPSSTGKSKAKVKGVVKNAGPSRNRAEPSLGRLAERPRLLGTRASRVLGAKGGALPKQDALG